MNQREWYLRKTILLATEIWCIFNYFNKILGIQISFIFSTENGDDEWDKKWKNNFVLNLIATTENSNGIKTSSGKNKPGQEQITRTQNA